MALFKVPAFDRHGYIELPVAVGPTKKKQKAAANGSLEPAPFSERLPKKGNSTKPLAPIGSAGKRKRDEEKRVESDKAEAPRIVASGKNRGRRRRAAEKRLRERAANGGGSAVEDLDDHAGRGSSPPVLGTKKPAKDKDKDGGLLGRMRARLAGGQFRSLNELLYTRTGDEGWAALAADPTLFGEYHAGFRAATAAWPQQPVERAIAWLAARPAGQAVGDFGCGDAALAAACPQHHVTSLDLVSSAPGVIACNMAATPLKSSTLDAAVFCLSLMGTDYGNFLAEARRALKPGGSLWIAEVRSRFAAQDALPAFEAALSKLGFNLLSRDENNKMFVILELRKRKKDALGTGEGMIEWPQLKACVYKKRESTKK